VSVWNTQSREKRQLPKRRLWNIFQILENVQNHIHITKCYILWNMFQALLTSTLLSVFESFKLTWHFNILFLFNFHTFIHTKILCCSCPYWRSPSNFCNRQVMLRAIFSSSYRSGSYYTSMWSYDYQDVINLDSCLPISKCLTLFTNVIMWEHCNRDNLIFLRG
jgi:hypothetical protein